MVTLKLTTSLFLTLQSLHCACLYWGKVQVVLLHLMTLLVNNCYRYSFVVTQLVYSFLQTLEIRTVFVEKRLCVHCSFLLSLAYLTHNLVVLHPGP